MRFGWFGGISLLALSLFAATRFEAPVRCANDKAIPTAPDVAAGDGVRPKVHYNSPHEFQRCQALGPAAPHAIHAVDSTMSGPCGEPNWQGIGPIPWQAFAQGEYVGHERLQHVPEYRIRVDDQLDFVYRLTREETGHPYRFEIGDELQIENIFDPQSRRNLIVQPDGSITLQHLGQRTVAGFTLAQLQAQLNEEYKSIYRNPNINITPLKINARLEALRASVDRRFGAGGQNQNARVTPEGTIQLPGIGSVPVQGLSINELRHELNARYAQVVDGIEVTPILSQRADRYVYVLGEVGRPGRVEMTGPMTAMQAIAVAGDSNVGGNLRQVVVFRRGDDWRLMATMLDLRGALYGRRPAPSDEIWLNDSDIVIVPKSPILVLDDWISLVFTRGLYGVIPFNTSVSYAQFSRAGSL